LYPVADKTVEHGGLRGARKISHSGTKDLPVGMGFLTGYSSSMPSIDDAEKIAQDNPFIASIRVYEIMAK
jgi:hypothetical protein